LIEAATVRFVGASGPEGTFVLPQSEMDYAAV
jgi:hypothetical protein